AAQATDGGDDHHAVPTVTGAHLARALDDLLDSAQGVTRALLGVGVDPATLPVGGALGGPRPHVPVALGRARPGPASWVGRGLPAHHVPPSAWGPRQWAARSRWTFRHTRWCLNVHRPLPAPATWR
ncbi:MAG: hypothetical protein ACRDNS_18375, partial [Trebonia sp.]